MLWDIYLKHVHISNEKNNYPKESIILLSADEIKDKLNTFPEDIYLFDNTYTWTIALTHESNLDNSRFCLIYDKNLKMIY